jgi:hypothetical protein
MCRFRFILLLIIIALGQNLWGQTKGVVYDMESQKPLPFVNIRFDQTKQGCTSDIDGRFEVPAHIQKLHLFYVGYLDTVIELPKGKNYVRIGMQRFVQELSEVEIFPGINPAHRIIELAIKNRKKNRPEHLNSFSYVSYNKMVFTAEPDSGLLIVNDSTGIDSSEYYFNKFIKEQHFLLMESVSKRSYLEGRDHELVKASRVSGLKKPFFMMLATQFQSFSFYEPQFTILGTNYINPLSPGSTRNYFFLLQDTIYDQDDSVFIISFRPLKNKTFDGMKGLLYIHTDGYAVQNVIAEPYQDQAEFGIKIQQLYEKIDGKAWFPTQLNTTLTFSSVEVNDKPIMGFGTTYLDSIKIDPPLKRSMFRGKVNFEVAKGSEKVADTTWDNYRIDTLSQRDRRTYAFMDSVGREYKIDRKITALRILATGKIPLWKFSIPINRLIMFNEYEKFRLGLGIETNERISHYFQVGGYFAYGTGDQEWKYGGELNVTPKPNSDFEVLLGYKKDVEESGSSYQFANISAFNSEIYREVLVNKMNKSEDIYGRLQWRMWRFFLWKVGAEYAQKASVDYYLYQSAQHNQITLLRPDFDVFALHLEMKMAWGEALFRSPYQLMSLGTKKPVLQLHYERGIINSMGALEYNRIDFQLDKVFYMKYLGKSRVQLRGGWIDRSLPWYLLYNSLGSYMDFYIHTDNSFNTMRINEFLSDRYAALFWQHDFGRLIFKNNKYFTPDWVWVNNIGWGALQNPNDHKNLSFNTMEKTYMETGLILNKIISSGISSIGFGVYYRYGPYSLPSVEDNFSYRLSVGYNF